MEEIATAIGWLAVVQAVSAVSFTIGIQRLVDEMKQHRKSKE
jgi:hypothetical protein